MLVEASLKKSLITLEQHIWKKNLSAAALFGVDNIPQWVNGYDGLI